MPINYGDVVSYSAGDGTNWQVNPARILQIRTPQEVCLMNLEVIILM